MPRSTPRDVVVANRDHRLAARLRPAPWSLRASAVISCDRHGALRLADLDPAEVAERERAREAAEEEAAIDEPDIASRVAGRHVAGVTSLFASPAVLQGELRVLNSGGTLCSTLNGLFVDAGSARLLS
jgi:hypothetical protein